ncbi:RNA polymerase sigma-70 factor [Galbibacter sp. EGI 63066]|uniref:RNA polymerase sigma-70 factor n=1 Tax=Galbibacter sp. EGI 63066 TaxID=2993559 RepID=UPI0022498E15|nr:RNA polymerase sigma-70 factor [Galbibacter sp. EGI 63066]MCX2681969.1 RNA polymerase sigma-70 factor [Galbibacter sp. EGI 63066]
MNSDLYKLSLKDYKKLFVELYKPLCLFADKYVENLEESKDIVQEVFLKIWKDEIEFKSRDSIKSFLYTSVKNKCLNHLKSKRYVTTNHMANHEIEKLVKESFFLREIVIVETSTIIEKAINTLPNKCKKIIRLSIKNLTNSQIAEELGISVNTVKTQKRIAYKRLKPLLGKYFSLLLIIDLQG